VTSLSKFVAIIPKLFDDSDDILFRGQSQDWPLLPKIARIRLRLDLLRAEQSLLSEFKLQAPPLADLLPQTDWEWLSLAQHYGMATRLLDWTSNPLAALWFATEKPAEESKPAVVWAFDPADDDHVLQLSSSSPFSGERTRVFQPPHIARRITAQSGWFTVHKYIVSRRGFVPLEQQSQYKTALAKIVIPSASFSDIRYDLAQCGFSAASMLTDLTGICSHIEWRHSLLNDETDEEKPGGALSQSLFKARPRKIPLISKQRTRSRT